ncbi:hypothetical protein D3C71_1628670 [compost metagenome]
MKRTCAEATEQGARALPSAEASTAAPRIASALRSCPKARPTAASASPPSPTPRGRRQRSSPARRAKKSTPTNTVGSKCSSTGTGTAALTKTAAAGYASPRPGRAATTAACTSRASGRRSSWTSSMETRTTPSSPGACTTPCRCRPGTCRPTKPSRASKPTPAWEGRAERA